MSDPRANVPYGGDQSDIPGFPGEHSERLVPYDDWLTTGEEAFLRSLGNSNVLTLASQQLRLTYFTARKTETIASVRFALGGTAAGATPTLSRIGIWTADGAGALVAQIAATTNDTALFMGTINTQVTKALTAPFVKQAGQRYAVGLVNVTAAANPTVCGNLATGLNVEVGLAPRLSGVVAAQADLPATLASGSIANDNARPYVALVP